MRAFRNIGPQLSKFRVSTGVDFGTMGVAQKLVMEDVQAQDNKVSVTKHLSRSYIMNHSAEFVRTLFYGR